MGKARNGAGSIRKRKTGKLAGRWRLQWYYDDPVTKEFVSVDKTFQTEGQAKAYFDDLKARVVTGQLIAEANQKKALTLNAWFDDLAGTKQNEFKGRWFEDGTKPLTISTRVIRYNKHVRGSNLGTMAIKNIRTDDVRAFIRHLKVIGRTEATIKDVMAILVKVVNDAIRTYEKLPNINNAFANVKVPRPPRRMAIALEVKEGKEAIQLQLNQRDKAMLGLYLLGGVRLSEQMALCKEQVDFKRKVILIDRAVKLDGSGQQTIGLPKGDKVRMIAMCPTLANLLQPLMSNPGKYLFPAATLDKPMMKKHLYTAWKTIKKQGKLPPEMTFKDCRLTHNNWIEKLMPRVSLSTRLEHMGHATTESEHQNKGIIVNLTNYTRFLSEAQNILRKELEKKLGLGNVNLLSQSSEEGELEIAS